MLGVNSKVNVFFAHVLPLIYDYKKSNIESSLLSFTKILTIILRISLISVISSIYLCRDVSKLRPGAVL